MISDATFPSSSTGERTQRSGGRDGSWIHHRDRSADRRRSRRKTAPPSTRPRSHIVSTKAVARNVTAGFSGRLRLATLAYGPENDEGGEVAAQRYPYLPRRRRLAGAPSLFRHPRASARSEAKGAMTRGSCRDRSADRRRSRKRIVPRSTRPRSTRVLHRSNRPGCHGPDGRLKQERYQPVPRNSSYHSGLRLSISSIFRWRGQCFRVFSR